MGGVKGGDEYLGLGKVVQFLLSQKTLMGIGLRGYCAIGRALNYVTNQDNFTRVIYLQG